MFTSSATAAAEASINPTEQGPLTLSRYAERWLADRRARGLACANDDDARLRLHALPILGKAPLSSIRPLQIRDLIRQLCARMGTERGQLAPRTVRHVYGVLHRLFEDALAEDLIDQNPCVGLAAPQARRAPGQNRQGPALAKQRRVYPYRGRVAPLHRGPPRGPARVLRPGLPRRDADRGRPPRSAGARTRRTSSPLGKLVVAASYNTKGRLEKGVKTGQPREVSVHPVLAALLERWRVSGFPEYFGRAPKPEDLLVPSREFRNRTTKHMLHKFHEDCERLGLRLRRHYDSRRTFISLTHGDGGRKDILRWITHGPEGDIVSLYTTLPWKALCDEVAKLRIQRTRTSPLIPLRRPSRGALPSRPRRPL